MVFPHAQVEEALSEESRETQSVENLRRQLVELQEEVNMARQVSQTNAANECSWGGLPVPVLIVDGALVQCLTSGCILLGGVFSAYSEKKNDATRGFNAGSCCFLHDERRTVPSDPVKRLDTANSYFILIEI